MKIKTWKKENLAIITSPRSSRSHSSSCAPSSCSNPPSSVCYEDPEEDAKDPVDDNLTVPLRDNRPTSDKINLRIPQAYGLTPTAQEKSMFRSHPFNPLRYERQLSPGAEIGNYCRSPRESLVTVGGAGPGLVEGGGGSGGGGRRNARTGFGTKLERKSSPLLRFPIKGKDPKVEYSGSVVMSRNSTSVTNIAFSDKNFDDDTSAMCECLE